MLGAHQRELDRQYDEERQHQAAVVAAARRRQRDEFAQREERDQGEQHGGDRVADAQAIQNTMTISQDSAQQAAEVLQLGVPGSVGLLGRERAARNTVTLDGDQDAEHDDEQRADLLGRV